MSNNNSLTLSDKLVLVTLEILIPQQKQSPILQTHIANISGVSPRTVRNSLRRLRDRGIVSTQRSHKGSYYIYSLHRDKVPQINETSLLALLL